MTGFKVTSFNMTVFNVTCLKTVAAVLTLAAGMAMPVFAPAQAASEMKVAMAMPMHHGKMVRHGMRSMRHHAAKRDDRYGMK
jgi:Ni/Co efflux regulator RcnB